MRVEDGGRRQEVGVSHGSTLADEIESQLRIRCESGKRFPSSGLALPADPSSIEYMFDSVLRSPAAQALASSMTPPLVVLNTLSPLTPDGAVADTVAAIPAGQMSEVEQVEALQTFAAHRARTDAQMLDLVAAIARRTGTSAAGLDSAREEVSCALSISGYHAERMVETARALEARLPATRTAMLDGLLSYDHAAHLAQGTRDLTTAGARQVEAELLGKAMNITPKRFAKKVAMAAAKVDPAGAEKRYTKAKADRHIETYPREDGMASLYAYGPAADIATIALACDTLARRTDDDGRTLEQKRFDALLVMATLGLAQPGNPTRKRRPAQIFIKMTPHAARGLAEDPAELLGYGPIPASAARDIADDAEWKAFLVDSADQAFLGLSTTSYRPTRRLDDHIATRDETCTFPHCGQSADLCDTEHAIPYNQGSATDEQNCAPMCRRHHRLKTHGGWQVIRARDGTVTWISPLGLTYITSSTD
ncbi:MAG TPA: DUF222 domain-containing protein [Mycobacteriales bacterium]|nr:DUF222 domain-containing protein [Mycobacteriales bacterium]